MKSHSHLKYTFTRWWPSIRESLSLSIVRSINAYRISLRVISQHSHTHTFFYTELVRSILAGGGWREAISLAFQLVSFEEITFNNTVYMIISCLAAVFFRCRRRWFLLLLSLFCCCCFVIAAAVASFALATNRKLFVVEFGFWHIRFIEIYIYSQFNLIYLHWTRCEIRERGNTTGMYTESGFWRQLCDVSKIINGTGTFRSRMLLNSLYCVIILCINHRIKFRHRR